MPLNPRSMSALPEVTSRNSGLPLIWEQDDASLTYAFGRT
jgi:hypothetical protein